MRTICDVAFSIVALIVIVYGFFILKQLTMGEFLIAIMVNYVGARYLLMADLDLRLTELEIEAALEQQEQNNE
jgi:predicted ABC-type sugar transport system permease subunit